MKAYVASHLKDMNRKKVYYLIRGMESTSKAEIAKLTGISSPTVIKIVNFLTENGLVREIGAGETQVGRKPQMLTLNKDLMYIASFVLEGDFFSAGIVDICGRVIYQYSMAVDQDVPGILNRICDEYVEKLFREAGIPLDKLGGIGIALPVIYNKEKSTLSGAVLSADDEVCVADEIERIEKKYGVRVYIENDTNAQALGEFELQNLEHTQDLLFISLGTGLGAGIILGGKLRRGERNMSGEIGYISYNENYRSDKKAWGWLEAVIGFHNLREKFGLEVDSENISFTIKERELCVEAVAAAMAKCVNNISVFLDCTNVVLGGKTVEILGGDLIERTNQYLEHLSMNGTRVKMEASPDVGMVGIASLVTDEIITDLLMEKE